MSPSAFAQKSSLFPFIELHHDEGGTSAMTGFSFWIPPSVPTHPRDAE
jgi:hypothetical protein